MTLALIAAGIAPATSQQSMDHSTSGHDMGDMDHSGHDMGDMDHSEAMQMDINGMVMNANSSRLPNDCPAISQDVEFTVRANVSLARTGLTYGYDQHQWDVPPCSRVTVTFINEDQVRHQWMVHGLPKYLYPTGMFHMEANGGITKVGTFIVASDPKTLLVHCDMSHHMEQGLKGQIKVGGGTGNLPSIPGISGQRYPDNY